MNTYILGLGGFAKEVFEQIILQEQYDLNKPFAGFITYDKNKLLLDGKDFKEAQKETDEFILATGIKKHRSVFINSLLVEYGCSKANFPNYFAKTARVAEMATLGYGNLFCDFSLVNANAVIRNFNCFNAYSSTYHDTLVGSHNILSPYSALLGNVRIGDKNFLGAGATITPLVEIGDNNTLSAGEYLFDDMDDNQFFRSGIISNKP